MGAVFVKEQRTSPRCMSLRACAKFASIACASEALLIIVALSTWSLNNLASSPWVRALTKQCLASGLRPILNYQTATNTEGGGNQKRHIKAAILFTKYKL